MRSRHKGAIPRFGRLKARNVAASRVGAANTRENTQPELMLRRELWAAGVRYRLHPRDLPGRPDLVIRSVRVAVFCDGDFWHGRDWRQRKARLSAGWNAAYWVAKIERNRQRDRQVDRQLRRLGWAVLRFWETDLKRDASCAIDAVMRYLR
jgi:DNA mismatch endonuclease (patch repair protein)